MPAPIGNQSQPFNREAFLQQLSSKQDQQEAQSLLKSGAKDLKLNEKEVKAVGTGENGQEMAQAIEALQASGAGAPAAPQAAGQAAGGQEAQAQGCASCSGSSCPTCGKACAGTSVNAAIAISGSTGCTPPCQNGGATANNISNSPNSNVINGNNNNITYNINNAPKSDEVKADTPPAKAEAPAKVEAPAQAAPSAPAKVESTKAH